MHRRDRIVSAFLLAAVTAFSQTPPPARTTPPSTSAAQNGAAPQDEIPVFTADSRLVVVHASVLDQKGKLVTNLQQPAFKVLENGVEQPIKIFRREDIPVSLGIIIDNSGSMHDKKNRVAAAALNLVKASNPQDEVFIVNFNDDAYLDQPFTNSIKKMEEALDRMDAGDYGVCLACDEPIAEKRLLALPWARYCVSCQDNAGFDLDAHRETVGKG